VFFQRFTTVAEQYTILVKGLRTMPRLFRARKAGLVS
jgi:hypothetical protein